LSFRKNKTSPHHQPQPQQPSQRTRHPQHPIRQPVQQIRQSVQQIRHPAQQQRGSSGIVGSSGKPKPSIHPVKYRLGETEEQRVFASLSFILIFFSAFSLNSFI